MANGNRYNTEDACLTACHAPHSYEGTNGCLDTPAVSQSQGECINDEVKTLGPRSNGGCQTCICKSGAWDCHGVARVRREIADFDDAEFAAFADAVNALKRQGDWDKVVQLHGIVEREAHRSNKFLHWHRKYLFDLETMLQSAANSCDVTLPYWNWAYDMGIEGASVEHVWGDNRYGALDTGNPDDICGFGRCGAFVGAPEEAFNKDRCPFAGGLRVRNGLFGDGSAFDINFPDDPNYTMPLPGAAPTSMAEAAEAAEAQPFGAIHRCWNGGPVNTQTMAELETAKQEWFGTGDLAAEFPLNPATVNSESGRTHPRCDEVIGQAPPGCCPEPPPGCPEDVCPPCPEGSQCTGPLTREDAGFVDGVNCTANGIPDYGFVTFVETQWHNGQHCNIGGYMCGFSSPHDPVFWAHHAFVDKIWFDWQLEHLTPEQFDWTADAGDFDLPWNVCGPQPPAADETIPASDVENSRNMFDGKGKVTYVGRAESVHCDADVFQKVQCCAQVLSAHANGWSQVERLSTSNVPAEDVCSPVNAGAASSTQLWMHTLVDAGCMSQDQADSDYQQQMTFLTHVNENRPFHYKINPTECEKSLCLDLDHYFQHCHVYGADVCF